MRRRFYMAILILTSVILWHSHNAEASHKGRYSLSAEAGPFSYGLRLQLSELIFGFADANKRGEGHFFGDSYAYLAVESSGKNWYVNYGVFHPGLPRGRSLEFLIPIPYLSVGYRMVSDNLMVYIGTFFFVPSFGIGLVF